MKYYIKKKMFKRTSSHHPQHHHPHSHPPHLPLHHIRPHHTWRIHHNQNLLQKSLELLAELCKIYIQ